MKIPSLSTNYIHRSLGRSALRPVLLLLAFFALLPNAKVQRMFQKTEKNTLGQLFGQIRDATGNAASFLPRFEALVEERNWLIHRSRHQNRKDLYDDVARQKLIDRIEALADEALQLAKALEKTTEDYMIALGIPKAELDRRAAIILGEWTDQT